MFKEKQNFFIYKIKKFNMILTEFVKLKVNVKNINHLKERGYEDLILNQTIEIRVKDLSKGSHIKISTKCYICGKVRDNLMYKEYLRNLESGGYYSCKGKCSSDKNRQTSLINFGVDNPSKSIIIKEKVKKTISEFSVEKLEEMNKKYKETLLEKYKVDNPSKSQEVKDKRKLTMNLRYGVDFFVTHEDFLTKSKETFIQNYGVEHPMKIRKEVENRLKKRGLQLETNDYRIYRKKVDYLTKKNKKILFENWNGFDYYDGEFILDNFDLSGQHGDYPTIDHKVSVYFGFTNNIEASEIASLSNLCITKRRINSKKYINIDFKLSDNELHSK